MNKKILIQLILSGIIIITIIFMLKIYFQDEKRIEQTQIKTELIDEKNLIVSLEYSSIDKNGNNYTITAENGKIDEKNNLLIHLNEVKAEILLINNEKILIFAKNAIYNNKNNDTQFFNKVEGFYLDHAVNCENLDLIFSKDIAILYNDLIYKQKLSHSLYADKMEINLDSKSSKIFMNNDNKKVKIIYKGLNGDN